MNTAVEIDNDKRMSVLYFYTVLCFNPLNAELNRIYHLLALLGVHHFLHVSRIRVKYIGDYTP
jgi:hypothetical protein